MDQAVLAIDHELQRIAAARSQAYRLFAEALEYPESALHLRIAQGEVANELVKALAEVDASLLQDFDAAVFSACGTEDDLQVEYTRLFDPAASKDACRLYEIGFNDSRDHALEESLRFYDYFGLALSEEAREMPDYIVTQLEFLHYLAYCQSAVAAEGGDPESFRMAEKDFIERHLGRWVPKLNKKLQAKQPMPCYGRLVGLLAGFLAHTLEGFASAEKMLQY